VICKLLGSNPLVSFGFKVKSENAIMQVGVILSMKDGMEHIVFRELSVISDKVQN